MTLALVLSVGLLGVLIGSFLNVVVYRVPAGLSVVQPALGLPGLRQRHQGPGQRACPRLVAPAGAMPRVRQPISVAYPLVELGTGGLFAVMAVRFGVDPVLPAYLYLAAVGLALALIDLDASGSQTS